MRINLINHDYNQQNIQNRISFMSVMSKSSKLSRTLTKKPVKSAVAEIKAGLDGVAEGIYTKLKQSVAGSEYADALTDSPEAELTDSMYNSELVEEKGTDGEVHLLLERTEPKDPKKEMRSDGILKMYFRQIRDIPVLSAEEEYEVAKKAYDENDEKARQTLINSNLKFVISVAKKYMYKGLPLIDLIQEGNYGLLKAAKNFDYTKGIKFISYAVWQIEAEIRTALAEKSRTIELPVYVRELIYKIKKATSKLTVELGRAPTMNEIADKTGISEKKLESFMKASKPVKSLDEPLDVDDSRTVLDTIPSDAGVPDREIIEAREENAVYVKALLSRLSPRERKVLSLRFGINTEFPKSTDEIASICGISHDRALKIERRAMKKLKELVQK